MLGQNRPGGALDDFIIPSRVNYIGHLSTRPYTRLVGEWGGAVGLPTRWPTDPAFEQTAAFGE